jgi:hypothetical protein
MRVNLLVFYRKYKSHLRPLVGILAAPDEFAESTSVSRSESRNSQLVPAGELDQSPGLSSRQAFEAIYRFVASYYDYERIAPILRLLSTISATTEGPDCNTETWATWLACVEQTLDAAPLPTLPPPWDF